MGCRFLLQGIFPTKGSNLRLLYCRQIPYLLSHQGSIIKDLKFPREGSGHSIPRHSAGSTHGSLEKGPSRRLAVSEDLGKNLFMGPAD